MVSISINPKDDVKVLKRYAKALNAETKNWWFLTGPSELVHNYVEKEMKFMMVEPNDDSALQPFFHDYGLQVFGRDWKRKWKRDLHYARQQGEVEHEAAYQDVRATIIKSLAAQKSP